ncbi:MAG: hypothetical protein LW686_02660 [Ilumatobacteraceae bacterium]|nr:hypothetical protein [Ilumatobacteraceae bacterium]
MTLITSGVCNPRNLSINSKGSIHDDATATELGFRAGTVAGDIHLEQFGGILNSAFGQQWCETGSLSMYFMHATADAEPVEATLDIGESQTPLHNAQIAARMHTPEGITVAEGTASVGNTSQPTALYSRDRRSVDASTLKMLRHANPGRPLETITRHAPGNDQILRHSRGVMTSPLDWYVSDSPWGGPICSPLTSCRVLVAGMTEAIEKECGEFVGLYGAIEIRHHNGPLMLDTEYTVTGRVLDVSDTPKTEVLWYTTEARVAGEPDSAPIASLTMMTRLLKNSSPLYSA